MDLTSSSGFALGGASAATSAASMRAARLARFQVAQPAPSVASPAADGLAQMSCAASEAGDNTISPGTFVQATHSASGALSQGFAALPEAALLRITASLDLQSGAALTCASPGAHENTAAALQALDEGISQAQEDHRAATAAIQQQRHEHQTTERALFLEVLGMLAPLRNSQIAQQRHGPAIAQLFGALDDALVPTETPLEEESAPEPPEVQSSATSQECDSALLGHVTEPNLPDPLVSAEIVPAVAVAASLASDSSSSAQEIPHRDGFELDISLQQETQNRALAVADATATMDDATSSGAGTPVCSPSAPVVPCSSLSAIPEGPLLRLAALMDLNSGAAFNAADSVMRDSTEAAFRSLAAAVAQVRSDEHATTAGIEQERLEARQHQTAEGAAWATALELLAPHRNNFDRLGMNEQVAQLFGMLQQGPEPQQAPEMEAAFEARIAEAAALALSREAAMRARVADGHLRAELASE